MKRLLASLLVVAALCFGVIFPTTGAEANTYYLDGMEVSYAAIGYSIGNVPDYDWWYGCFPTSAGMMMGYYDTVGYEGFFYTDLVPGTAESSTYWSTFGSWDYNAQYAIASPEHVTDFYSGGYDASGDDGVEPFHSFNCLADFCGTSQDSVGMNNGYTGIWFYTNGDPLSADVLYGAGPSYYESDGMFGLWEYAEYSGYSMDMANFYTQLTYPNVPYSGIDHGFTFADYMAEIDAGKVVLLHVEGHTMIGYGYDEATQTVYLYDTWSPGPHSMTWGGSYSGMDLYAVTSFTPMGGGSTPIPPSVLLFGSGLIGIFVVRKKGRR